MVAVCRDTWGTCCKRACMTCNKVPPKVRTGTLEPWAQQRTSPRPPPLPRRLSSSRVQGYSWTTGSFTTAATKRAQKSSSSAAIAASLRPERRSPSSRHGA